MITGKLCLRVEQISTINLLIDKSEGFKMTLDIEEYGPAIYNTLARIIDIISYR